MKPRSAAWIANQAATASAMSRISGYVEFRYSDTILSQLNSNESHVLTNNVNYCVGEVLNLDACVVKEMVFMLSGTGSLGYTYDIVIWTYDPVQHKLGTLVGSGQHVRDTNTAFSKQECTFKFADTYALDAGYYAFLLVYPSTGSLTFYHAGSGDPCASGFYVSGSTRSAGSVMNESPSQDMYFRLIAPAPRRWNFDNGETVGNVMSAEVRSGFDPSNATLPIDSCSLTIENAKYASDANKATDYDFTDPVNYVELRAPGSIALDLGFQYDSGKVETNPITKQQIIRSTRSKDDATVTFEAEAFTSFLDDKTFYGGWYSASGIPASTLFAEILDDARFPNEGKWAYTLGDTDCKVHAAGTKPLWERNTFAYYSIDAGLANQKVYIPIPPVTHREALTMLAAYVGAYIFVYRDGSIWITASYPQPVSDYHIDLDRIYDRPDVIQGGRIGTIVTSLHAYTYPKGQVTETIADSVRFVTPDTATKMFRLIHDPCEGVALTLTGATLVGTPTYRTYSTEFMATPNGTSFSAKLEGWPVAITSSQYERTYQYMRGDRVEFNCPIATGIATTNAMLDRFYAYDSATRYRFSMRDDPAIEIGDRLTLELVAEPDGIPVVVTDARRTFNGGLDCEYTVVADPN